MRVAIDSELLAEEDITYMGNVELIKSLYVLNQNIEFVILGATIQAARKVSKDVALDWMMEAKHRDYYREPVDIYITNINDTPLMRAAVTLMKGEYGNKRQAPKTVAQNSQGVD